MILMIYLLPRSLGVVVDGLFLTRKIGADLTLPIRSQRRITKLGPSNRFRKLRNNWASFNLSLFREKVPVQLKIVVEY